jgi:hypothetical protein
MLKYGLIVRLDMLLNRRNWSELVKIGEATVFKNWSVQCLLIFGKKKLSHFFTFFEKKLFKLKLDSHRE